MQYQGSGVTPGKNVDCAAISTLFVTICWPLWTEGEEKKWGVMQEAGREIGPIIWASDPSPLSTTCQKYGAWDKFYFRINLRICYHCCSTIISYDSCVKSLLWSQWPKCLNYTALCNLNWFYYAQYGSPQARTGTICEANLVKDLWNIFIIPWWLHAF